MSIHRVCSVCDSPDWLPLLVDAGQPVVRCARCGFIYCEPIPDPADLADYYTESYENVDSWELEFRQARALVFGEGLRRIRAFQPTGKLLDVGCSLGFFLEAAQEAGYDVTGVDVSRSAANFARERLGLNVRVCALEDAGFEGESFDIVTLWDVLEHLPNPAGALREINRITRPGGLLVVRLPNVAFHLPKARVVRAFAPGRFIELDAHNHVNHYAPHTLTQALSKADFTVERLVTGPINVYGKPVVDTVKQFYVKAARAAHHWTDAMVANIMEAYATKTG